MHRIAGVEEETHDRPARSFQASGRKASEVVSTVAVTLAVEFPHLPFGALIAATIRSLRGLQRVPLTTLLDAPFNDVLELVEEQTRQALRRRDEPGVTQRTERQGSTFMSRGGGTGGMPAGTSVGARQSAPVHAIDGDGASLCGHVSAEDMRPQAELAWDDVPRDLRCPVCQLLLNVYASEPRRGERFIGVPTSRDGRRCTCADLA